MTRRSRSTGDLSDDWREFLSLLISRRVRFVVVGGHAVAVHARPRFTKDLDVYVDQTPQNARRLLSVLEDFGFGKVGLKTADLETPDKVVMLGVAPQRIDVLTGITGVRFAEAWRKRVRVRTSAGVIPVLSRDLLIRNKRAAARPQDLADLSMLGDPKRTRARPKSAGSARRVAPAQPKR